MAFDISLHFSQNVYSGSTEATPRLEEYNMSVKVTIMYWSYNVGVIAFMEKLTILLMSFLLGPNLFLSTLFLSICNLYLGDWIPASSGQEDGA